jgi:hypothetical protein
MVKRKGQARMASEADLKDLGLSFRGMFWSTMLAGSWAIIRSRGHDAASESKAADPGSVSCLRFPYDSLRDAAGHDGKSRTYKGSTADEQIRAKLAELQASPSSRQA